MIKTQFLSIIILAFGLSQLAQGQTVCTEASRIRLDSMLQKMAQSDVDQLTLNEKVVQIGKWFLNTPYVEKTLEVPGDEPLVINLEGLDCTTYVETIVTLARLADMQKFTYEDYEKELEYLRYRNGSRNLYPSRLHYFSDWIFNNQEKGILEDITKNIGGEIYENTPKFMSDNPQYYTQLSNENYIEELKQAETEIKNRSYFYIPKEAVHKHENKILPGDLIAITISMDNLDISHTGIAVMQNGRIHLMHASSASKKVEISHNPLSEYLMNHKSQSGIMVCRLLDPMP